ncbi:hypothetical protein ARMSODRAFT_1024770 [Armillaria solidipes]|uniref:CxC2-like cysteine cluster KDZ transposase-associated domain-containing protein n=1 Tax=Armillaria solidipes TaxID=1076256 RepID=A0A2H3AUZ3_9AGAR|nr:hypothetical protein ARMSODRAFT_1024770 [Armillaria solidipes]
MSKVSGYEFYQTLVHLTDNTGTELPPDRFQAFMCMVREWRHIKLLKRKLDRSPQDLKGSKPGELPIPAGTWKHTLYLAIDANFRLVRLVVSNSNQDPSLLNGAGFIVQQEDFRKHVAEYGKRIPYDPSDCRDHQAVKLATTKRGAGLATSGVATVDCARHDCKGPSAVTILDHREEQVRIDYIFCARVQHPTPHHIVVSYDINCQWSKKLWERIAIYPPSMKPTQSPSDFAYLIPKFHLPAHIVSCHAKYSFYKTPHVGETDGEAPERGWSCLNPLAASLKVMGPGGYLDTLDDHIGDYSYCKTASMNTILLTGIKEAIPAWVLHAAVYIEFTATLPSSDVLKWTKAVEDWEADPSGAINPFESTVAHTYENTQAIRGSNLTQSAELTTNKVRLMLAKEEAAEMAKIATRTTEANENQSTTAKTSQGIEHAASDDDDTVAGVDDIIRIRHEIRPSTMILQGVDLESDQLRLKQAYSALGAHSTDQERAKVMESLNRVRRRLEAWVEVQQVYMPAVVVLRAEWNKNHLAAKAAAAAEQVAAVGGRKPWKKKCRARSVPLEEALEAIDLPLFLPSTTIGRIPCSNKLLDYEFQLREAEAYECLATLRRLLIYRSHIYKFKDKNITGQAMSTRARATIKTVIVNIDAAAARYRSLWANLGVLASAIAGGKPRWDHQLHVLEPADVRALEDIAPGETEGRHAMTWIWRVQRHETDAEETAEALRIEWCKTRARAHRWQEEVILVLEEMKRVKAFFAWEARTWLERAAREDVLEGERGYALRQADMHCHMRDHCSRCWKDVPTWLETGLVPKSNHGRRKRLRPTDDSDIV